MTQIASVILAAGKGTRMKSHMPKVLHNVCGKPMLEYVIMAAQEAGGGRNVVVIGHEAEMVRESIGSTVEWAYQAEQLGTGHAVMQAENLLVDFDGSILILCGDTPLITAATLTRLISSHRESGRAATVLTAIMEDPGGYGRIVRDPKTDSVLEIVEHKDASSEQLEIKEINTGMYCFEGKRLFAVLTKITPANAQGEYYLTDVLAVLRTEGEQVGVVTVDDPQECMGINDRIQLAEAEKALRLRVMHRLMMDGVTILDPGTTYIDFEVTVGPDSVIYPGTIIEGRCRLGENCLIGPYTRLKDTETGNNVTVHSSIILESSVGNNVTVGPFAYIRPGTVLSDETKVGDFVEIKKSVIGRGSKVPHLSYVGDAVIGEKVNIGAGTITCNYDGTRKYGTVIGSNAFIGSNTNLVAPIEVGESAVVGAGSTLTKDVPDGALCVERSKQVTYPGWAARKNKKK